MSTATKKLHEFDFNGEKLCAEYDEDMWVITKNGVVLNLEHPAYTHFHDHEIRRIPINSNVPFSPGPWRYCGKDREQCKCGQIWSVPQDFNVVECFQSTEEGQISQEQQMANARLVAAAPEMYELLKGITEGNFPDHDVVQKVIDKINNH